jgi:glycosyltransferase involved in cell wall biosynthesis
VTTARVVLNARVAARPTITGVERWALEVFPRLRALAPHAYAVARPPAAASAGPLGQLWEQAALPVWAAASRTGLIFSPANLAPLAWPRNVVLIHDAAPFRRPNAYAPSYSLWHQRVGATAARRALRVVTVSDFSARELSQLLGLDPARVSVIAGGVGARFSPSVDPAPVLAKFALERRYVLTIGTAEPRKNLQALTVAVQRLGKLGVDVVWAGDARRHFSATAAVPGLRALGYVHERDLPGLYRGASAFVLPSVYEGFGLPCLEAMACGVPVVTSDRAALPEVCGTAAVLVDPDDRESIADALMEIVQDVAIAARLRESGIGRAAGFSWERAALKLHALLSELAAATQARRQP